MFITKHAANAMMAAAKTAAMEMPAISTWESGCVLPAVPFAFACAPASGWLIPGVADTCIELAVLVMDGVGVSDTGLGEHVGVTVAVCELEAVTLIVPVLDDDLDAAPFTEATVLNRKRVTTNSSDAKGI